MCTGLSKDATRWLAPAAEGLWQELARSLDVRADPGERLAFLKRATELRTTGLVVEVGLRTLRAGLASALEPRAVDLSYDSIRGDVSPEHLISNDDLPPPAVRRQGVSLADPAVLRRLVLAAASALGYDDIERAAIVLVRPPAAEPEAFLNAARRACADAAKFGVVDCASRVDADVVLDLGHFRASALPVGKGAPTHQRLAGAALTTYVAARMRDAAIRSGGAGLSGTASAEIAKREGRDDGCLRALLAPSRAGPALALALGDAPANSSGLAALCRAAVPPKKKAGVVLVCGGAARLPGLRKGLASSLPDGWRLAPADGDPATWAWRTAAKRAAAKNVAWDGLAASPS